MELMYSVGQFSIGPAEAMLESELMMLDSQLLWEFFDLGSRC